MEVLEKPGFLKHCKENISLVLWLKIDGHHLGQSIVFADLW